MSSDAIGSVQRAANLLARNGQSGVALAADGQRTDAREAETNAAGSDQIVISDTSSRQRLDTLQRIDGLHEAYNATVKNLRETRAGLDRSAKVVDKMNGELDKIIKNYPPFSVDDGDRKQILMSYISLKKEIDSLMVPPPPPPVYEKVREMWQDLFAKNSGRVETPALQETSSDKEVKKASATLASTSDAISRVLSSVESAL